MEAERVRRAKSINAQGELQAARTFSKEPGALQLRYFGAPHNIAGERASTIVFPLPIDLLALPKSANAEGTNDGRDKEARKT